MCGIMAYVGTDVSEQQLISHFEPVKARGPDYSVMAQVGERLARFSSTIMDPTPAESAILPRQPVIGL